MKTQSPVPANMPRSRLEVNICLVFHVPLFYLTSMGAASIMVCVVNPVNGLIAINGYPGQLQMVDVSVSGLAALPSVEDNNDSSTAPSAVPCAVTDALQVVSYNRVSRIDNVVTGWDKPHRSSKLYVPSVSLFAFHTVRPSGGKRSDVTNASNASSVGSRKVPLPASSGGHYLATVDVTRGEEFGPETSLKIWKWDFSGSSGPQFKLLTQVQYL